MKRTYLGDGMLVNYLLLALRNLKKQRGYALVNIFGLAVGLGAALYILLYVKDELTFDRMHPSARNLYRLGFWSQAPNGDANAGGDSPAGWDNYIQANYEGIGSIASFIRRGMPTSIHYIPKDKIVLTEDIIWAEPSITDVLSFPIVKGAQTHPLKEINIMLTESTARDIFEDEDPIGKVLTVSNMFATNRQNVDLLVTAVMKDFPSNTHIDPKYIANIFTLKPFNEDLENRLSTSMGYDNNQFWTESFFVCSDEQKIETIVADLQKQANQIVTSQQNLELKVKPIVRKITDVHFDQEVRWSRQKSVDIKYIYVFVTIAFLILLVAGINYINLATAKSATRAREIGLRKTFGGIRTQLFLQFMMESFVLVVLSALLAIALIILLMPQFNALTAKTFSHFHVFNTEMLLIIGAVILIVNLLAGSYPALFVSGFQPAHVLKGKFAFRRGSNAFRQALTTIQFVVAVILLSGTFIVVNQMDLMRNSKLNESGSQMVSIRYGGFSGKTTDAQYQSYKTVVLQDPQIEDVTLANHLPLQDYFASINMRMQFPEISEEQHEWFQLNGDFYFPRTFNMRILAGRDFDPKNVADSTSVLLNESAVKALQLTPDEAIGKTIIRPALTTGFGPPDATKGPVSGLVIGVVEDFPYQSMHQEIKPLAISPKPKPHTQSRIIYVRLPSKNMAQKLADLEKKWKQIFPDFGFDYWFIDEEFGRMYENETRVAALTEKFSWLAILVGCVGLYGLASFMAEQRTKEIGIRKTMGASNGQILLLLLTVFGKLLLIASVIGVPVVYILSQNWLESFVYRTSLSFAVFAGAVGLIGLITMITVGYESLKASLANPVTALKHE